MLDANLCQRLFHHTTYSAVVWVFGPERIAVLHVASGFFAGSIAAVRQKVNMLTNCYTAMASDRVLMISRPP